MALVGIVSDTHAKTKHNQKTTGGIPPVVLKTLSACSLIIHCGDIGRTKAVIPVLEAIAPLVVIKGNHDKKLKERIPWTAGLELEGWRIWVVHGHGGHVRQDPLSITGFLKQPADVLIFGHTHQPLVCVHQQLILINPGSISDTEYTKQASFMTMEVKRDCLDITIYYLDSLRQGIQSSRQVAFLNTNLP